MKRSLFSVLFLFACAVTASAQCVVQSASLATYGNGCAPVFTQPTVGAAFDATNCVLELQVNAPQGCCNTFVSSRVLVLGAAQANLPVPQLGRGCSVLVSPNVFLLDVNPLGGQFQLTIPPIGLPFSFFAQAGAFYFTTIGLTTDVTLSQGYVVTLL